MAFSGNFVSGQRVKKAIREVVLAMCREGHLVLVGRGGVSIAHNIKDALHIRLVAPFYWRVENVMRKKSMGLEATEKFVIETDEKRHDLIQIFLDKKYKNVETLFDATLNRISFSVPETADLIVSMYEKKVIKQVSERKKIKSFR